MTILITGGNGNLSNCLKEYIDGDFYGKDMLDLTDRNCVKNLPLYDMLIHTATGTNININLQLLYSKAKKNFRIYKQTRDFFKLEKIRAHRLRHREIKFKFYNLQTQFTKP